MTGVLEEMTEERNVLEERNAAFGFLGLITGQATDNHGFAVSHHDLRLGFLRRDHDFALGVIIVGVVFRMQVKQDAVVARNVRSNRQLDTRFHKLRRRFTTIVNHADRHLVTHEHLGFGVIKRRDLRTRKHLGRSVTHQARDGQAQVIVKQARCNRRCGTANGRSSAVVREGGNHSGIAARTSLATIRPICGTRSHIHIVPKRGAPVHAKFAGTLAVHHHELRGNHNLEGFHIEFCQGVFHLLDFRIGIIDNNGVRTFHDSDTATTALHAFEHLHEFIGLGMVNLEVLTNQRSRFFLLFLFVCNLLLLRLVSTLALHYDVLVLNNPGKVVDFADNIKSFLPSLLRDLEAHLALHIGSKQDIHARNNGHRTEYGVEVGIHKGEVIQLLVGLDRSRCGGSPDRGEACNEKQDCENVYQLFHF